MCCRLMVALLVGLMSTHAFADPSSKKDDGIQKQELEYVASQPDSRLATPEDAFNLFKSALRSGNLDDLKASVTPAYWQRWGEAFQQLSKEQLNEIEGRMENLIISQIKVYEIYAYIHLQQRDGKSERTVNLEKLFGNWKIDGP